MLCSREREAPEGNCSRVLTFTRSLNRDDTDGCCLLCDVWTLLAGSKEGLWVLWVGLHGPVGEGKLPTSRLIFGRRRLCVVVVIISQPLWSRCEGLLFRGSVCGQDVGEEDKLMIRALLEGSERLGRGRKCFVWTIKSWESLQEDNLKVNRESVARSVFWQSRPGEFDDKAFQDCPKITLVYSSAR